MPRPAGRPSPPRAGEGPLAAQAGAQAQPDPRQPPELSAASKRQGLALAAAGAVAFSGKAIIVKLAYRYGVDAVTLLMYRMLFSLPLFVALAWWAGRGKPALTRRDWRVVVLLGFSGYYLASFLDFAGLAYISASLERLILYLNPTLVLAFGVVIFRHRVTRMQLLSLAVSYAGVLLVFGHEIEYQGGKAWLGAALVFASTVSYAGYLVYSGAEVRRLGALRLTGLASTVACLLCLLQFVLLRPLAAAVVAPQVIQLSILNAAACTVAPVLMMMLAIERIGATLAAQTGMIGPLSTILMSILLLGEPFTAWLAAGSLLVMAGIWMLARSR
ncbi:MAG: DMT family transporter [Burkholderiales bacterium]|nr:DMT family transporter [Burkholderiales bacterium]